MGQPVFLADGDDQVMTVVLRAGGPGFESLRLHQESSALKRSSPHIHSLFRPYPKGDLDASMLLTVM